jgi:hypothetical protein
LQMALLEKTNNKKRNLVTSTWTLLPAPIHA